MQKKLIFSFLTMFLLTMGLPEKGHAASGVITIGPASGLAHAGVGGYHDVDTMILNPSWLADLPEDQVTRFGMLSFSPTFKSKIKIGSVDTGYVDNKMGLVQLPHMAYITKLSDNVAYGLGFFSGGGSGANFTEATSTNFLDLKSFFGTSSIVNSVSLKNGPFRAGLSVDFVSGILSSSVVAIMNITCSGGSSIDFSSALNDCDDN